MRIETLQSKTLEVFLEEKSLILSIPRNQRRYSWKREQLEEFFFDIKELIDTNKTHYLGVVSLVKKDDTDFMNSYEVVDGQQRITTSLILISAIRDIYIALDREEKAKELQKDFLSSKRSGNIVPKLKPLNIDVTTLKSIVDVNIGKGNNIELRREEIILEKNRGRCFKKIENPNINMIEAYNYFYNEIIEMTINLELENEKIDFIEKIISAFRQLEIIMISSRDLESIFSFFDSLNNRGMQLKRIDIVKNNLFEVVAKNISGYEDEIENLWDKLILELDGLDENKFLKYYYMCVENNKIIPIKEIPKVYKVYFSEINNFEEMEYELNKIINYAKIFSILFNKNDISSNDEDYIRNIKFINKLGQQACHSFLMDYLYVESDVHKRCVVTKSLEKMILKRVICKESVKGLDGIFKDLINLRIKIDNKYVYDKDIIIKKIKEYSEFTSEFEMNFLTRNAGRDEITNYILRRFEYNLKNNNGSLDKIIKSRKLVNIEHILPSDYSEEWAKELKISKEKYKEINNKIGNLILLDMDINSSIKKSKFNKKLKAYEKSDLSQIKNLIENYNIWNEKSIDKRGKEILNNIKELFSDC